MCQSASHDGNIHCNQGKDDGYGYAYAYGYDRCDNGCNDSYNYNDVSSSFYAPFFIRGGGPSLSDTSIDLLDPRHVDHDDSVPMITQVFTLPPLQIVLPT